MRVTRLEIFGFKSFLEKLVLPLEAGFTGVVGPNGCGKSNIVDALRWVLGESRASQLRGGALEDVIFNGTDKLRPLGLAEVTMTLRASQKDFFSEIVSTLTRQGNQFAALLAREESSQAEEEAAEMEQQPSEGSSPEGESSTESASQGAEEARPHLTVIEGTLLDQAVSAVIGGSESESRPNLSVIDGTLGEAASQAPAQVSAAAQPESGTAGEPPKPNVTEGLADDVADEEFARHALNRFGWLRNVQEVQITRRLYRSGESEFFINRVSCRLKDMKELFRLVGLGARAYTIVAQGEVGRIVTARPEERRLIIEEAAGVSGFREKIATANRRLEETTQNLVRLDDVSREVQRQVNSLRVQASRAKAREQLKARITELERILFADSFIGLQAQQKVKREALAKVKGEEGNADAAFQKAHAEEQEARGSMLAVDVEGDDIRRRIDSIQEELRQRSERKSRASAKLSEINAQVEAAKNQVHAFGERKQTLTERRSDAERTIADLESKDAELVRQLGELGGEHEELVKQLAQQLSELRDQLRSREQEFRSTRDRLVSAESRSQALREQIERTSPVAQMKDVLALGGRHEALEGPAGIAFKQVLSALGDGTSLFVSGLSVPGEYVKAVQAALAERVSYLVSDDLYGTARSYSSAFREVSEAFRNSGKQKRFEPPSLGLFLRTPPTTLEIPEAAHPQPVEGAAKTTVTATAIPFKRLLEVIDVKPEFGASAEQVLSHYYVADSVDEATRYFEERVTQGFSPGSFLGTIVTKNGEVLTDLSFFCAGRTGQGVLHLQREAEELEQQVEKFRTDHQELATFRETVQQSIYEAERRHGEALAESRRQQARAREISNQQGAVRGRLHAEKRLLSQLEQDVNRIEQQVLQAKERIEGLLASQAHIAAEVAEFERVLDPTGAAKDLTSELAELRTVWEGIDKRRKEGRSILGAIAQRLELARNDRERIRQAVSRGELEVERVGLELQSLKERVLTEYGAELLATLEAQFGEAPKPQVAQEKSEENQESAELLESQAAQVAEGAPETITSAAGEASPVSAPIVLEKPLFDSERSEFREEVQKIRARIAREGEVDSSSIQRFEEEEVRLKELGTQKHDLSTAADTLKRTIEKLRETSEKRFLSTFEAVRNNFLGLIPRLFGGGKGTLELTDPTKPLECGIDIMVRPPGKKPKSIELLSGGEKALCAIAMIVSMFMERPSPLCVLDEVDAPLDEANLVRFLSLLKDMSNRTQFVVITHNKQTMTVADQLIGVTMQQPGASTVVTVSLNEAYQHVA
jgi:chromosome segregation protein